MKFESSSNSRTVIRAEARIMSKSLALFIGIALSATIFSASHGGAQEFQQLPQQPQFAEVLGPPLVIDRNVATTLQLPTFSFFTISTTVLVPDSGTGYLGGAGRGGSGTRFNGLGSRAGASGVDIGGMTVTAQIHDFKAMDRALLGDKAAPAAESIAEDRWISRFERAKESTAGRPTLSVAEARRRAISGR